MIRCGSGSLQFDLPANNADQPPPSGSPRAAAAETQASVISEDEWKRRERENILTALRRTDWQIYGTQGAAQLLGINPATLASRMKKLGLKRTD